MAQDCYKLFKSIYAQAVADGLAVAVATAAAQSAMDNCLKQQSLQVPAAQPVVTVPGTMASDPGPAISGDDRASSLGIRSNKD